MNKPTMEIVNRVYDGDVLIGYGCRMLDTGYMLYNEKYQTACLALNGFISNASGYRDTSGKIVIRGKGQKLSDIPKIQDKITGIQDR